MDYLRQPRHPMHNATGFAVVALLHMALIYALVNGFATVITERAAPPMTARILNPVPPQPAPPTLPAPDLPVPLIFLPRVELKAAPPPARPNTPSAVNQTPPTSTPVGTGPRQAPADTKFSPSTVVGGEPAPSYPPAYEDAERPGQVTVDCVIEMNGYPSGCRIVHAAGGEAFAAETLRWLTGPGHPIYRPALQGGVPQRMEHQWVVTFEPPAADSETR
jgi:protein TonB